MDKLKTKILLISLLLVLLFSVQSVAATTDSDGNLTGQSIDLSICDNTGDVSSDKLSNNPDNILSSSNELDVLGADEFSYAILKSEIEFSSGNVKLHNGYYKWSDETSTITISGYNRIIDGNGSVIDMKGSHIQAFQVIGEHITIKNLTIKNVNSKGDNVYGGAICFFNQGSVVNCNFVDNKATGVDYGGGAVLFNDKGTVTDCNFIGNYAWNGGAVYFYTSGTVENCNFTKNNATNGGAVYFKSTGTVTNCNFTKNKATKDGAVYFNSTGTVTKCNFIGNSAGKEGGAVSFKDGTVTKCNFIANSATNAGAVVFWGEVNVTNCNFTDNTATEYAGAILMAISGSIENCSFTNNKATVVWEHSWGGAVLIWGEGNVTNCNFTNNKASRYGGAIHFYARCTVTNCNFIGNSAGDEGGAVVSWDEANVTNCNFTGNNAPKGSAIFFGSTSARTVSNSRFLNNRANAEKLEVIKNDNNITITFTGQNNLLNAIYSNPDVTFTNVAYWSAKGINNTGSSAIKPLKSNREAGQNITVKVVVNDVTVLNEVRVTDENGMIVLDISAGENYNISVRHDADSYYTEAENTASKRTYNVNVTSQTTNNRTVNITAKSNILNEIIKGKLLFILPNGTEINANYAGNGIWWALHTFADYGVYKVNASYTGLDNVTINNGTVTINSDVSLSVVKSANATEVGCGSLVQFTIIVTNYGSSDVTSVEVSDWLPEGLTFVEAGVINSEGQYEVFDSPDLLILIDGKDYATFNEFSSSDIIEDGGVGRDIVQYGITRISGGNSVVLLITARANGLVMGNITNEVTVWYHENETDIIVNSTNVTVVLAKSFVSADDVEVTYGDSIVVVVTSENAIKISYQIISSGAVIDEGSLNVGENITGLDLAAGEYSVNLTTVVNSNYTSCNYVSKITVNPANSTVKAEDVEVTYGDSIVVVVTSENATGVSYQVIGVDGVVKEGTVNVGQNITDLHLAAGEYTVNLTTMVNANYTVNGYTSKITVNRANSSISADDVEVIYGETIVIPVSVVNASEFYYAVVNEKGTIVDSDIIQAGLNITVENLSAGKYNVTLITGVDSNHTSVRNASKITVNPAGSSVSAEDAVAIIGDAISIPVSSANATEISYSIIDANNKAIVNGTIKPGEAITVSDLAAGDYTVSLTTVVDSNHTSVSNSSKLHIRGDISIIIAPVTGYAGEVVCFTAQFKYENGDPVDGGTAGLTIKYGDNGLLAASRYSILSADESSPVSEGKATFNVKLGEPGIYQYVVTYSSAGTTEFKAESTLTILKAKTTVSGVDISGKPSNKKDITVTVLDQDNNPVANGTVTLTLNEKPYNSSVENGKAVLSVELPNPGSYNATVTYNGNDYYNSSSSSIAVDVEKVNTNAPSAEDISGKAGDKIDISVKFVDENGNPVKNGTATLTVDGKTYTAEVTNGVATFKDVVIPEKDAVADVYYQGNGYYNASSTTFSIKVKQNNNTKPDNNNTDENKTTKHVSSKIVDGNATGNPIAMMLLALFVMVITYRKK